MDPAPTMSTKYKVVLLIACLLIVALFAGFDLISYGLGQLRGQLRIINGARSIETIRQSGEVDVTTWQKLEYIDEVRRFAVDTLGFIDTDNYTTYYDQQEKPVMWVVTGCLPFEFKEKTWWFPIVGNVSYKGFFDEEKALREAAHISMEGYEADIYNPEAWSTLGYFTDPVLSNMLRRGPGKLAELIIHELAHSTVFLPDAVELNENLATMAGELGALMFLQSKFGKSSIEYTRYANRLQDDEIYYQHMLKGYNRLDSLYDSFDHQTAHTYKARNKYRLIAKILLEINDLPLSDKNRYRFDFEKNPLPGNTEFMAYSRYRNDQSNLKKTLSLKYQNDIGRMLRELQEKGVSAMD